MLSGPRKNFAGLICLNHSFEGLPGGTVACTKLNIGETLRERPAFIKYLALQAAAVTLLIAANPLC